MANVFQIKNIFSVFQEHTEWISKGKAGVPQELHEFADLEVMKVRPNDGNIMINGCFDHYVYLKFDGIGRFKEYAKSRQIILSWGEFPPQAGSQVLWKEGK